jgi:hypothetical protein
MLALTDSRNNSVHALSWQHKLGVLALHAGTPPSASSTRHDHMQKIAGAGRTPSPGSFAGDGASAEDHNACAGVIGPLRIVARAPTLRDRLTTN